VSSSAKHSPHPWASAIQLYRKTTPCEGSALPLSQSPAVASRDGTAALREYTGSLPRSCPPIPSWLPAAARG